MSTEGTKGGESRPASRPEIEKLPADTCIVCGLKSPAPIVVGHRCASLVACQMRVARRLNGAKRRPR